MIFSRGIKRRENVSDAPVNNAVALQLWAFIAKMKKFHSKGVAKIFLTISTTNVQFVVNFYLDSKNSVFKSVQSKKNQNHKRFTLKKSTIGNKKLM